MIGRFGSSYFWGSFADRYGRLPVIYVSHWPHYRITSVDIVVFASSDGTFQIAQILRASNTSNVYRYLRSERRRFLLGASNGLVGISKTMISEVCGPEHEVVGMSFILGDFKAPTLDLSSPSL